MLPPRMPQFGWVGGATATGGFIVTGPQVRNDCTCHSAQLGFRAHTHIRTSWTTTPHGGLHTHIPHGGEMSHDYV